MRTCNKSDERLVGCLYAFPKKLLLKIDYQCCFIRKHSLFLYLSIYVDMPNLKALKPVSKRLKDTT